MAQELVQLTKSEKISLTTTEVAKQVRTQLKAEFPDCKFSVTAESYSMGSCLHVTLLKADRRVMLKPEEVTDKAILSYASRGYGEDKEELLRDRQRKKYHQLSEYASLNAYDVNVWNNGVFLTEKGHNLLKRVTMIVKQYNYNNSDSMTDYYDINFAEQYQLGTYNKDFEDGA